MKGVYSIIVLTTFLATGSSWLFTSTHTRVVPELTDDVTLRCFNGGSNGSDTLPDGSYRSDNTSDGNITDGSSNSSKTQFGSLTRIRLVKLDSTNTWRTFAKVVPEKPSNVIMADPSSFEGIIASGHIGTANESFLALTWSTATFDILGSYKCEVNGFTASLENDIRFQSSVVKISFPFVSVTDLLKSARAIKKRINMLENKITSKVQDKIENNFFEVRNWPTGPYTLMSSVEGCPNTAYSQLDDGYIKIETTNNNNIKPKHNFSSPTHLITDVCKDCGSRNFLQFKFCSNTVTGSGIMWPRGSYCIHGSSCPTGFTAGYTRFYTMNKISSTSITDNVNNAIQYDTNYNRYIIFNFCCRHDGDVDTSILLPNDKGFYLYRYKGKCQRVSNTHVTNEWIEIDTDNGQSDSHSNSYHADGTINKGRLELCYYTKKDNH